MKQKKRNVSRMTVFRRWNNKGYAVFNSLKRVVKIGCLMAIYLRFANHDVLAARVGADTTSVTQRIDLNEITVSANLPAETYSNISRVVVSVTPKEIERAAVSSVNELLEYASNIDIRQRGTNATQADVSVRGSSFDQVLILLNGINITDPQTGHHNLNLPIDLSAIDHIEILKGPGSWKFGPGAFGGAINFITKAPDQTFIQAGVEGGQYATFSEKVTSSFHTGNLNHFLTVNNSSSDGYINNTDYRVSNIFYHGNLTKDQTTSSFQLGYTDTGFGSNSFYSAKYPDQYEALKTLFTSFSVKTAVKNVKIEPNVYFRRKNDCFHLFRQNPGKSTNYHTVDVWGSNLLFAFQQGTSGVVSLGFDLRTESIWSNTLGELTENPVKSPMNDTITLNYSHSRTNFSSFLGYKHYFDKLTVNAGMNLTRNSDLNFKWFIYPGVDLSYQLSGTSSISASVNKTMRMPTYTDLYYKSATNEGNPSLSPEEAVGYELGFQNRNRFLKFSATGFYSQGKNMIDWVKENLNDKWKTVNYTSLNTIGSELSANANLDRIFPGQPVFHSLKVDYTFLYQKKPATTLISYYALNYLKHRIDVNLNHSVWKNVEASWHFSYQNRNGQYEKVVDKVSQGLVDYEPFWLCDLTISYRLSGWNFYGSANNLFNVNYYDIGNIQQPGRWFKVGIIKKFEIG